MTKPTKPMPKRTLAALKASIKHWEEMSKTGLTLQQPEADQCALCRAFLIAIEDSDKSCQGCPIFEATGIKYCGNTPYEQASRAADDGNEERFKAEAKEELSFLQSLLPEGETV